MIRKNFDSLSKQYNIYFIVDRYMQKQFVYDRFFKQMDSLGRYILIDKKYYENMPAIQVNGSNRIFKRVRADLSKTIPGIINADDLWIGGGIILSGGRASVFRFSEAATKDIFAGFGAIVSGNDKNQLE